MAALARLSARMRRIMFYACGLFLCYVHQVSSSCQGRQLHGWPCAASLGNLPSVGLITQNTLKERFVDSSLALSLLPASQQPRDQDACFQVVADKPCLNASSPACGAGVQLTNVTFDFDAGCVLDLLRIKWTLDGRAVHIAPDPCNIGFSLQLGGLVRANASQAGAAPSLLCLKLPPAAVCKSLTELCRGRSTCRYSMNLVAPTCRPGGVAPCSITINAATRSDPGVPPFVFGFGGIGFRLPYQQGVALALSALNLLRPGETPLAGASSGSILASATCFGVPLQRQLASTFSMALDCRSQRPLGTCFGNLDAKLAAQLQAALPNGSEWRRCNGGALHVAINLPLTNARSASDPANNHEVGGFASRDDVINAVRASSFLPGISNGTANATRVFRGIVANDGGLASAPSGWVACPVGVAAAACVGVHGNPPAERAVDLLPGGTPNPADPLAPVVSLQKPASIYPGKYQATLPLGLDPAMFRQLSLLPGNASVLRALVDYGVADGLLWAKEQALI